MSDNHDAAELEALAANPRTDWDVLHWIAENHPSLRPTIAANPGTYQELVDALGALGDPDIDYAIALRHRGRDVSSATAATNPLAGMYDTATHTIPAYQPQPGDAEPYYTNLDYGQHDQQAPAQAGSGLDAGPAAGQGTAGQDPDPDTDPVPYVPPAAAAGPPHPAEPSASAEPAAQPEPPAPEPPAPVPPAPEPAASEPAAEYDDVLYSPDPGAAEYDDVLYSPDPGAAEPSEPQPPVPAAAPAAAAPLAAGAAEPHRVGESGERRRAPLGLIAAAILGVVAVGAVVAVLITLLGGDDETPVAEPPASPTEEAPAEEEDDPTEAEETEPAEPDTQENLEQVRAEVASLPEESACQADEDSGVVAQFVAAGTDAGDFPGDEDADLMEETFSQLQSECSSTHAASVFTAARGGTAYPDEAPEGAQAAMDSVGTDWVDRVAGLRGADTMSGFTAQDGNVECEFDDGVICTVYNTNPEQCETGATYRMTVDEVELDCDAQLDAEDRDTLAVDDSATDGFLVCTEMSDRVSCYNTVELFGFEISSTGNYPY